MSDDSQEELAVIKQTITTQYCLVAALVFILYDTILCFDLEFKYIWKRKPSLVTFLYIASRYGCVVSSVFAVGSVWPTTVLSCIVTNDIYIIASVITSAATVALGAFRVWAIWTHQWIFFLLVLATGLVLPCIRIYYATAQREDGLDTSTPVVGQCSWDLTISPDLYSRLAITGRALAIISDALVLILTWAKTYSIKREAERTGIKARLSTLLIRDGTIYFLSLFIMNVAIIAIDQTAGASVDNITWFSDAVSAVAICHLVLNLRTFQFSSHDPERSSFDRPSDMPHNRSRSIYFASHVLDNMGAPVSYGYDSTVADSISTGDMLENPLAVGLHADDEDEDEEEVW